MARHGFRLPRFYLPSSATEKYKSDREDSGVQLDEPSYPLSKHVDGEPDDKVHARKRNVGVSKKKCKKVSENKPDKQSVSMTSDVFSGSQDNSGSFGSDANVVAAETVRLKLHDEHIGLSERCSVHESSSNDTSMFHSPDQDISVTITLNLDEDEGLGIRDSNTSINKGDDSCPSKSDSESSSSDTEYTDGGEKVDNSVKRTPEKDVRKRRFRKMLPGLKRSQSIGCEKDLVPEHALFLAGSPEMVHRQDGSRDRTDPRKTIHKTCSADAAMMACQVLPLVEDPQELVKQKQKTSIAKNMRKKLQKLRRRNTDSLLGAAILSMKGTPKITPSDAAEWATSFDALLTDKNGLEMFRNFLKSEFSEENIEFWIACEEFKTIRTNKMVSRSQKIYDDFIAIKSPKQVNLDSKTRLETITNLENPTRDLFKQAQKRIHFLMENDSYKRFLETDAYKQLL